MKAVRFHIPFLLLVTTASAFAQKVIELPFESAPSAFSETYPEKQYHSTVWKTEVVTNVTRPSLIVYKPAAGTANGTGIVICPGGGFMALSINSEGMDVAKWLNAKGVTAFVLKYRLAPTAGDATAEFQDMWQNNRQQLTDLLSKAVPLSVADGLTAMTYVRKHASEWDISPDKVGIVGFSAGGTVTSAVAFHYSPEGRPAFVAPIYAAAGMLKNLTVPVDAPPMFLAAATDDQLGLAGDSVRLYNLWTSAHKPAELHMYAKGGHGFGMRKQNLPSDKWIERFWDWLSEVQP